VATKLLDSWNLQGHCVCPLEDWGKLIGDVPSAGAILDRFLHRSEAIQITGRSYRLGSLETNSKRAKAPIGSVADKSSEQ